MSGDLDTVDPAQAELEERLIAAYIVGFESGAVLGSGCGSIAAAVMSAKKVTAAAVESVLARQVILEILEKKA